MAVHSSFSVVGVVVYQTGANSKFIEVLVNKHLNVKNERKRLNLHILYMNINIQPLQLLSKYFQTSIGVVEI